MRILSFIITTLLAGLSATGQVRSLDFYIDAAAKNSPLIADYSNQLRIHSAELNRLKALYTHSRLEVNGSYLFVPIVSRDGGHTSFKWNAQSATDYYGYDLGQSSGSLSAGVTWSKPLLGGAQLKMAKEQSHISDEITSNNIRLEKHQLERAVSEQYTLCLLDQAQLDFADSTNALIGRQMRIVENLYRNGLAKSTDLKLLKIEKESNAEFKASLTQSYRSHMADLNLMCGIDDTCIVNLPPVTIEPKIQVMDNNSQFSKSFMLDSLNNMASLRAFKLQYRPQLNLFINGGLQVGDYAQLYKHFGFSVGLTFHLTLSDGRQRNWKELQTQWQQNSIRAYRNNAELQRKLRIKQCKDQLTKYDEREKSMKAQLNEYERVLADYAKEVKAGEASVLDYITVLKSKLQAQKDLYVLKANRQLVVIAQNYWNW